MIKPNWDIFKTKFSENPQKDFEWFCYILFCKEFKQEKGIFRYKNQSAIETNPIKYEENIIGWQAKFYEATLSEKKDEILETLIKAKRDYPSITKVLFYTNKEWGQNKGKKPQGLIEIEQKEKELGITLVWRCASYFEHDFVSLENETIAKHFFTNDKSIFDLIDDLISHTDNIFTEIQTDIAFNGTKIKIDRSNELIRVINTDQKVIILSGTGGVGKTALIKDFYEGIKQEISFYLFKATEFELRNINEFFINHNFQEFIDAHKKEDKKFIVIDSAEKLLDLKNTDPFKEILSILVENNWTIIFTTRDNYLEDLNYQFFEIYKIAPTNIPLNTLDINILINLSDKYLFQVPKDEKLLELIKNPFYLAEYLKYYKVNEELDYKNFKDKLWNKIIIKSKPAREQCFLEIAFQRANDGQFFIIPRCELGILDNELKKDGILGYESPHGYFITHDIYEEWALEKIIDKEYSRKNNNHSFFNAIGQSLSIRRSFRNWISEKLLLEDTDIKDFVQEVITNSQVAKSWKNEIQVSVLLSDYSDYFFNIFKDLYLENNQELLKNATFWLRIACKEVDEDFLKQLGVNNVDLSTLKYVLTKPKGNGWKSIIKFIYNNLETIGIGNICFILPIIHDWNSKYKNGETTKLSSLIALQYYQWTIEKDIQFSRDDDVKEKLFQTILYGSTEIPDELGKVFDEILKNKWKYFRDPYYDLSKTILTKLEGISVSQILPKYVLQLANLFWTYTPKSDEWHSNYRMGVEQHFHIEDDHLDYYPTSAFQTPIYWLLQSAQKETIDFILEFTNKTVEAYAKSEYTKREVQQVTVLIDEKTINKQYVSDRLWCTYRGTQNAPHILESIHMALEKYFLENGSITKTESLEQWLLYLLKYSTSATISAVVASIVLAFPDKTFNVAKVLFKTKEYFLYDKNRYLLDLNYKNQLLLLKNNFSFNHKNEIYENERLNSCDEKHRRWCLENIFLNYQVFKNNTISEEAAQERQKVLWEILDNYYKELPNEKEQTEEDETWRMFLARMDYRKMKPTTKSTEEGVVINWNPEIEPKLKEKSEATINNINEKTQYIALNLWVNFKIDNDERYKQYEQYENDPILALKEVKQILSKLKKIKKPELIKREHSDEDIYFLFNSTIPGKVCAVLIRDYSDKLSKKDILLCKNIILTVASSSLRPNYQYQIADSVDSAISVLPLLFNKFPKEIESIKTILFLTLFDEYPLGMSGNKFNDYSIIAINKLWDNNFEDAQSLLFGYLLLKPKYENLRKTLYKENWKKGINTLPESNIAEVFIKNRNNDLQNVLANNITLKDCKGIEKIELKALLTAFQLIPSNTNNDDHKIIIKIIISRFAQKLASQDRTDKVDYMVEHKFLEKYTHFILRASQEEMEEYLKPFIDNFNNSEVLAELFKQFIITEDYLNTYKNFWKVWTLFKVKIIEINKKEKRYFYTDEIVKSYLFANVQWKEKTTSWHTLKDEDTNFFKELSQKIGHCPSVLYSISKLLNDIGSIYLDNGIIWISDMLKINDNLYTEKLETNTIYYIEQSIRKYIYKNREMIKKTRKAKEDTLNVLDYLINKGSVVGYILRENIL